jgi:hypothetical protein
LYEKRGVKLNSRAPSWGRQTQKISERPIEAEVSAMAPVETTQLA